MRFGLESCEKIGKVCLNSPACSFLSCSTPVLLNSSVRREVAFCIDLSKGLDFFVGLLIVGKVRVGMPIAKLPFHVSVKGAILGHEVTHHETFPSSRSKSEVERGVKLCRAF